MKTILYQEHVNLGARIVDFAGWQMPLQYSGILAEHNAVRTSAGIFDVSHMGAVHIRGKEASAFLNYLSANDIIKKPDSSATYTVFCNEDGGSVDDTIIYKLNEYHYFIVANASNRQKDFNHLQHHSKHYDVLIEEHYDQDGIIALQGPKSTDILQNLFPTITSLKPMRMQSIIFEKIPITIARTGYTGEKGYEIFASNTVIPLLWQKLLTFEGVAPCGLGARDTLRLEMGYALYGHELNDKIGPLESVASWVVKTDSHEFLGKKALLKNKHAYGLVMCDRAIARENCSVQMNDEEIGKITSGNFSPTLNAPIALFLSNRQLNIGDSVKVTIREKTCEGKVSSIPFI